MTSSTSTSGAEAPAVMPRLAIAPNSDQSMSLGALHQRRARAAGALGHLVQALRVRRIGRADHDHRIDHAAPPSSPPPGGWWWRSRCLPCAARRCAGKRAFSAATMLGGVVDRQRGLRHIGEVGRDRAARSVATSSTDLDQRDRALRQLARSCRPPRDGRHGRSARSRGRACDGSRPRDAPW